MLRENSPTSPRHGPVSSSRLYVEHGRSDPGLFRPHQRENRKKMYVPSWIEKVERSRRFLDETSTKDLFPKEISVPVRDNDSSTDDYYASNLSSSVYDSGFNPHELLERQYKVLHRNLLAPPLARRSKPTRLTDKQHSLANVKRDDVGILNLSPPSNHPRRYAVDHPITVKDFLDSDDSLGSDHYFKHLQCVKELAKRYRKSKKKRRNISCILEVDD